MPRYMATPYFGAKFYPRYFGPFPAPGGGAAGAMKHGHIVNRLRVKGAPDRVERIKKLLAILEASELP